jgi:hypothetical protein
MSIKIYSAFHKSFFIPTANWVIPIHAGKANSSNQLPFIGDDTGDNISSLNKNFCELTALYWIWKNADRSSCDVWGLCHYRRYFMQDKQGLFIRKDKSGFVHSISQKNIDKVVSDKLYQNLEEIFATHDAVLQKPMLVEKKKKRIYTLEENYKKKHEPKDWDVLMQIVLEKYPEYKNSVNEFNNSIRMSFYNMMIAKWEVWDAYLNWLFDILFEVKNRITVSEDPYQARIFGFMSERLINLFIYHNKIKTAYLPVASFEEK